MKKITKKFVGEMDALFKEMGLFSFSPGRGTMGLQVPVDTLLAHEGKTSALWRDCSTYAIEWTRELDDGLRLHAIGNMEDAKKHGLPMPPRPTGGAE